MVFLHSLICELTEKNGTSYNLFIYSFIYLFIYLFSIYLTLTNKLTYIFDI